MFGCLFTELMRIHKQNVLLSSNIRAQTMADASDGSMVWCKWDIVKVNLSVPSAGLIPIQLWETEVMYQ